MAKKYSLSEGSLRLIMKGQQMVDPIMQVLGSKRIASSSADKERFRLLLSDGKNVISFAMLTTQVNDSNGELPSNTIIKIKRYITSMINNAGKGNKRVLVILEMETLLLGNETEKIGNPEPLSDTDCEPDPKTANNTTNGHASSIKVAHSSNSDMSNITNGVDLNTSLQDQMIHPISSLSPYQNKWVIKARVTSKSQIRKWSNSRGEGQLFSIDLVDESGEIRCTVFKDLVDKYYKMIQVDHVYYISKCILKAANKQFCTLNNDYEMTFTNDTIIQECLEQDSSIPQTKFNFVSIDSIANMDIGTSIDVIGVCQSASELQSFTAKSTGKELKKKELLLVDQSNSGIALTLWGLDAEAFDATSHPVVAIKGAVIKEFGGGKNLTVYTSSVLKVNPDNVEAHALRGWFDNVGVQQNVTNLSARSGSGGLQAQWLDLKEVQNLSASGNADRGEIFQVKATIVLYRTENCLYKACPSEDCKKKVIDMENGMYNCEKCQRQYPNFKYRLLGSVSIGDWSGNTWVSLFASEAEKVLGMSSEEVGAAVEANSESLADIVFKANFKQFVMKCRAKTETYNDEVRLKITALKVDDINYKEYNSHLISKINQFLKE